MILAEKLGYGEHGVEDQGAVVEVVDSFLAGLDKEIAIQSAQLEDLMEIRAQYVESTTLTLSSRDKRD